jgi:formylglycine-generating enzyme required for sulfatase activity
VPALLVAAVTVALSAGLPGIARGGGSPTGDDVEMVYRPYPYDASDGREDPEARGARVNRGGSWYYAAWYVRTTYRATADQGYRRVRDLGARCAR